MIERTDDFTVTLRATEDEPIQLLTLEEFVEDIFAEDSEFTPKEADAIYEGLRRIAPNGEYYMSAEGRVVIRFTMPSTDPESGE